MPSASWTLTDGRRATFGFGAVLLDGEMIDEASRKMAERDRVARGRAAGLRPRRRRALEEELWPGALRGRSRSSSRGRLRDGPKRSVALFASEGARVACADVRPEAAREVVRTCGPESISVTMDVTSRDSVERGIQGVWICWSESTSLSTTLGWGFRRSRELH